MTAWILPWVADNNSVPGLVNIVEGLTRDGYPFKRLKVKPFKGPLLDKLEPILDTLELSDRVIVATNSQEFQSYSLANILPVVWSLTTRQRVYTTDTPDILRTLTSFSSWEGDSDYVKTRKRIETYPLLVWNSVETTCKQMANNEALVASLLHKRANRVGSAHNLECKTLIIYLYNKSFDLDRMEEDLTTSLGASLSSTITQGFSCINAHFKVTKPEVVSI
jgi:hypothetical protein